MCTATPPCFSAIFTKGKNFSDFQFAALGNKTLPKRSTLKCLSIGTPKTIHFPFAPNGKLMVLGVPIFKCLSIGTPKTSFSICPKSKINGFRCPNI